MLTPKDIFDAEKSLLDEIDAVYAEDDHEMRDAVKRAIRDEFAALQKLAGTECTAIATTPTAQSPKPV